MQQTEWPKRLWVVRHGESAGNVARDRAEADELERIDIAERDVDVPLSELGERQAEALGRWMAEQPAEERPTVLWVSPYVRAQQTAQIALKAAGLDLPAVVDERLREREFGILDGLTRRGIIAQHPDEAERRTRLGKFYHRPPGGESWSDTLLRLRGVIDDIRRDCAGERVLIVAHQVVVLLVRYVVERMTEEQILGIDRLGDVANCSVTSYVLEDGGTVLVVGGSDSTPGAVLLAGLGALRVGAGRLQVATVRATAVALGVALPEAAVVGYPAGSSGSVSPEAADDIAKKAARAATVILGPGLLDEDETRALLTALLPQLECRSLVLDAVALAALAGHEELLSGLEGVVLTPNSGEMAALLEGDENAEGHDAAARAAKQYGAVVATQGWVVAPDGTAWENGAGGVGLGTSGSGDVLAGAVGGLLARGAEPAQAAVWGQYVHAAAGDRLAARAGRVGFLARELLDEVPAVLASLQT